MSSATNPVRPQNVGRYLETIRQRLEALEGALRMESRAVRDIERAEPASDDVPDLASIRGLIDAAAYILTAAAIRAREIGRKRKGGR